MLDDERVEDAIIRMLDLIVKYKPNDKSDKDRLWAILKTDAEKLLAWWFYVEMQ